MKQFFHTLKSKMPALFWPGVLLCIVLPFACGKDEDLNIPDVPVNYQITVQEFNIKNKNGYLLVNNYGVAGLILTKGNGFYQAFDRCSTVNPEKRCKVVPDESGLTAVDSCSGAKYSLYDGAPVKAPAKRNLRQYDVQVIGGNLIHVTN
jgi:nitrite reductase/ring-hydroxylating ferredoxin subunit